MCMFCGGQCGGVGDFIISTVLPFLAVIFVKLKHILFRKNLKEKQKFSNLKNI